MNRILIIIAYIIIALLEIPALMKETNKRELILYSLLFSSSLAFSILLGLEIKLIDPAKIIENIVKLII
ncbi:hypothetical protein [Orenia marismortui]|uniref:hypothetical protein n=1 Tax=Orenia marismortui TaxID=46469 RepID=UPI00035EC11B|nr:hypothetical protein [Orenia marismortui]